MITKQIAGILYGYGYRLQDNEGNVWDISELSNSERMILKSTKPKKKGNHLWETILYSEIGSTYKILAREMDLTKPIEGVGVPMQQLAEIVWPEVTAWHVHPKRNEIVTNCSSTMYKNAKYKTLSYYTDDHSFSFSVLDADFKIIGHFTASPQHSLFNWLYTHHFNLDFPEGTTTNLI